MMEVDMSDVRVEMEEFAIKRLEMDALLYKIREQMFELPDNRVLALAQALLLTRSPHISAKNQLGLARLLWEGGEEGKLWLKKKAPIEYDKLRNEASVR